MRIGRAIAVAALLMFPAVARADDPKTYRLTIGDSAVEIDPGETLDFTLPGGKVVPLTLALNEFATYSGRIFSYVHPTSVGITKTDLGGGINQYLMASAIGTLVIVQEYGAMNPVSLNQLMLQELTKESIQAGGKLDQQPVTRKLADGKELSGLKGTVTMKNGATYFEVLSFGTSDQGVLMVTRVDEENMASEGKLLDKFWETLKIKL